MVPESDGPGFLAGTPSSVSSGSLSVRGDEHRRDVITQVVYMQYLALSLTHIKCPINVTNCIMITDDNNK